MINVIDQDKCIGCGTCFKSCSLDVFRLDTDQRKVSPCMAACPAGTDIRGYNALVQQGKLEEARALYRQILPLLRLTEETGELWQIVKYILKQRGFGTGTLRLPRQPISEGVKAQLDELLGKTNFA